MKFLKEEAQSDDKEKISNEYKKWASKTGKSESITQDNIDNWAKTRTCRVMNCSEEQFNEAILEEYMVEEDVETVADAAAKELDAKVETSGSKSMIEEALDEALDFNEEQVELGRQGDYQNLLFIGEAGTGKSAIVRSWARKNNINLYEVRAAGMDDTDLGGAISKSEKGDTVQRLASTEFDVLNRERSVLFLDEYNRAPKSVRTNLLELINNHVVPDPREPSGQRFLPNFLFTVAAINPANANYDTDTLDMAERTRFRNIDVIPEPHILLSFLKKQFQDAADRASTDERKAKALGRMKLAETLLSSSRFRFDTAADIEKSIEQGNGLALNYRTLTNLLQGCNGTKADFLKKWNQYVNADKYEMADAILQNYQDIEDKANDVLKDGTDSEVFREVKSTYDAVKDTLAKLRRNA